MPDLVAGGGRKLSNRPGWAVHIGCDVSVTILPSQLESMVGV